MREIYFRGLDTTNKWVYGNLIYGGEKWSAISVSRFAPACEVLSDTVGQYTGLKDKHDKRIFEGDIVREVHLGYTYVIKYIGAQFYCWDDTGGFPLFEPEHLEVIGNIHDNPEMVK